MLDAEARLLLDLMEQAVKDGRPKLHTLPYAKGRAAVDKMSEDSEADPPEVAETIDGTLAGPGGAIRFRRYRPLGVDGGRAADADLLSRRRLRDRQHRDARFDLPAARQQEPLPGDLDRLSPGARASLPRADRRCARGLPPHPRQRRGVRRRSRRIAVGGDSAGGTSPPWSARPASRAGEAMPAFQMLIYPATDCAAADRIAQAVRRRLLPDPGADRLVLEGLYAGRHRPHRPAPVTAARQGRQPACRPPSC